MRQILMSSYFHRHKVATKVAPTDKPNVLLLMSFPRKGLLKKPRPCHCEECGDVVQGREHDEAIPFAPSR